MAGNRWLLCPALLLMVFMQKPPMALRILAIICGAFGKTGIP